MGKNNCDRRRESTVVRDNMVHELHAGILKELGDLSTAVSKTYIYDRIHQATKLSIRTISHILNHTRKN